MSLQHRVDETMSRLDDILTQRLRREEAELRRDDAARADAARAKAREDAEACRECAAKYDEAFSSFSVETPQPRDGERPDAYRNRATSRAQGIARLVGSPLDAKRDPSEMRHSPMRKTRYPTPAAGSLLGAISLATTCDFGLRSGRQR